MSDETRKSSWDELMARLAQERDELALKLHLGKKEALAEWEKLEARWNELRTVKAASQGGRRGDGARGWARRSRLPRGLKKGYEKLRKIL